MIHPHSTTAATLAALLFVTFTPSLTAQEPPGHYERRFTFLEESSHRAKVGEFEFENWVTSKLGTKNDSGFARLEFLHEVEYGISERLNLGIDLVEWHYEDSAARETTRYDASAIELKYTFDDAHQSAYGLAYKTEVEVGPHETAWSNKLIVDKVVDRYAFGYNLELVAEWEGEKYLEFDESEGEIVQTLGVSYQVNPSLFLGAELVWEKPLPDWEWNARERIYLGPNLAWHGHEWAVIVTPTVLLSGGDNTPEWMVRMIFEFEF